MEDLMAEIEKSLEIAGVKKPKMERPPSNIDADLSMPCFDLAKESGKSPAEVAKTLASAVRPKHVREVKALGPYLNFYVDWAEYGGLVLKDVLKKRDKYGSASINEDVLMDVYQANPFKSFHIGHVRNALLGESIRRLLEFTGRKTVTVTYNGDIGVHVARWLWYYNNFYKGDVPKKNFTKWAGQIYAESSKKEAESERYKEDVAELNRRLDAGDNALTKTWKRFRELSYADFKKIAEEMEIKVDHNIPESECVEPGREIVESLYKEGKLAKSDGAIGIDLKKYGLGFFILLKTDGTALYSTKDFGLLQKKAQLGEFDRYLYVVGSEQDLYFQQLFKALELLGLADMKKHIHISYNLVTLKEGKMASRLGNVILYEDLRDEMVEMVKAQMKEGDSDVKNRDSVAKKVAFAAIKFQMLNIENNRILKFDWDQALDINGRSGPYLQYTCVRANSILQKAKITSYDASLLKDEKEIAILKLVAGFADTILKSASTYSPYMLCNYLFDLAHSFNTFYQSVPVLKAEDGVKEARMALVKAVSIVLTTGLRLLGIEVPEEM